MEFYLYLTPLSFYCLAQLWLMLWAATCSFINTGPGALWELPVCPLSGFGSWDVSVAPVWECMFAGYGVDHIFVCLIERQQIMRMCLHQCLWVCILAQTCEQRDGVPSRSLGAAGRGWVLSLQRAVGAHYANQPARWGENPVYLVEAWLGRTTG